VSRNVTGQESVFIKNLTKEDFQFQYDSKTFIIPKGATKELSFNLAMHAIHSDPDGQKKLELLDAEAGSSAALKSRMEAAKAHLDNQREAAKKALEDAEKAEKEYKKAVAEGAAAATK
jgi:hypothetical protein